MRFLFADHSAAERSARERVLAESDALWSFVRERAAELAIMSRRELEARLRERLSAIDPRIGVDLLDGDDRRAIVLSPGGARPLRPVIEAIAGRAPALPRLRVLTALPPGSIEYALQRVRDELGVDLTEARVRAGFARGHLLDIAVFAPDFASNNDERALEAAELVVQLLIGERLYDDWIGELRVGPLPRRSPLRVVDNEPVAERTFPLAELRDAVGAAVEGLLAGLPSGPLWRRASGADWTMFELEPELAYDYAAQDDLAIATTLAPEMLKCFLRGQPFSSQRFSRSGERFCYLKLDGDGVDSEARLLSRRALEDALEALAQERRGVVIGNGLGVRYAYVDLALADLDGSIQRVLAIARAAGVPRRSWLLFCDTDLAAEWVGVWDDGPPPPFG
jgi:hypothetical protein